MENKALLLLHLKGREKRSGQGKGFDEEEGRKKGTGERREERLEGRDIREKGSVRKGVGEGRDEESAAEEEEGEWKWFLEETWEGGERSRWGRRGQRGKARAAEDKMKTQASESILKTKARQEER